MLRTQEESGMYTEITKTGRTSLITSMCVPTAELCRKLTTSAIRKDVSDR